MKRRGQERKGRGKETKCTLFVQKESEGKRKENQCFPFKSFRFRRHCILNKICPCIPSKPLPSKSLPSLFVIQTRDPLSFQIPPLHFSLSQPMSHDLLITSRITNKKKRIMVGFRLFFDHFEQIVNSKGELTSESCFIDPNTM